MATLRRQPKSDGWQLRFYFRKKRVTLSLSSITPIQAQNWKIFVQAIVDRVEMNKPLDRKILEWLSSLSTEQRISIVGSSKTEHHDHRQIRIVPLFPEIERELLKLYAEPTETQYVFPELRADSNLRTTLLKIIQRAGLKPWPKIWQNLRSSAATDFARSVPSHVAASICGHTEEIAKEHYWTVGDQDLDNVIARLTPELSAKLAPKLALNDVSNGLDRSTTVSSPEEG